MQPLLRENRPTYFPLYGSNRIPQFGTLIKGQLSGREKHQTNQHANQLYYHHCFSRSLPICIGRPNDGSRSQRNASRHDWWKWPRAMTGPNGMPIQPLFDARKQRTRNEIAGLQGTGNVRARIAQFEQQNRQPRV